MMPELRVGEVAAQSREGACCLISPDDVALFFLTGDVARVFVGLPLSLLAEVMFLVALRRLRTESALYGEPWDHV